MSVCGQAEEESASEEVGAPLREAYEQKAVSKVVRVLTVLAYLLSVSLAAILLSVYYVCVWRSPDLPHMNTTDVSEQRRVGDPEALRGTNEPTLHYAGGGGLSVDKDDTFTQTTSNIASEADTSSTSPESSFPSTESPSLPDNGTTVAGADNSSVT